MKGLCLLWALVSTVLWGMLLAGAGALFFLGSTATIEQGSEVGIVPEASQCLWTSTYGEDAASQVVIEEALSATRLDVSSVKVDAYGEENVCSLPNGSETREFSIIDISPTITLNVEASDLRDNQALGELLVTTIEALSSAKTERINQLTLVFQVGNERSITWTATYDQVFIAWSAGMSGAEVYDQGKILE